MPYRALILLLAISAPLLAQTSRGTVSGLVSDPTGAVIAGAQIELRNQATGVARATESNEAGLYRFDAVDPGTYDLTTQLKGFKVSIQRGLLVQGGQVLAADARLEVGDTATTVEVSAEGVQLQTEAPVRGGNIGTVEIEGGGVLP